MAAAGGRRDAFSTPAREAFLNLVRTASPLSGDFHRLFRDHRLSMSRYNALRIVASSGRDGLPSGTIGERTVVRVPDVSRLVDRLEDAGLVARRCCTEDRRRAAGLPPRSADRRRDAQGRRDAWQRVVTSETEADRDDALVIGQDAALSIADVTRGAELALDVAAGRAACVHVARCTSSIDSLPLRAGDAAEIVGPGSRRVRGEDEAQVLAFDLPAPGGRTHASGGA